MFVCFFKPAFNFDSFELSAEHLNVQLFDLAKSYHSAMAGIDLSEFTAGTLATAPHIDELAQVPCSTVTYSIHPLL